MRDGGTRIDSDRTAIEPTGKGFPNLLPPSTPDPMITDGDEVDFEKYRRFTHVRPENLRGTEFRVLGGELDESGTWTHRHD